MPVLCSSQKKAVADDNTAGFVQVEVTGMAEKEPASTLVLENSAERKQFLSALARRSKNKENKCIKRGRASVRGSWPAVERVLCRNNVIKLGDVDLCFLNVVVQLFKAPKQKCDGWLEEGKRAVELLLKPEEPNKLVLHAPG